MVDRECCGYGPEGLPRQVGHGEKCLDVKPVRTAFRSPWQNGIAERFVGRCRKELFDHVIVLNERHLRRLMHDYVRYHHGERMHHRLDKTSARREGAITADLNREIICGPRAW